MNLNVKSLLLIFSFCFNCNLYSQIDSLKTYNITSKFGIKKIIIPTSLIVSGIIISGNDFEKKIQKNVRNISGDNFHISADDYLRYIPIIQIYSADIIGVKGKNHWFDQTKNLTLSILITDFITFRLKRNVFKLRPNGSNDGESFPSGHTSFAFTNASVLYEEFKNSNSWLAYSGYGFASLTGSLRIMNNAHWLSDVLVSAGIGILVTKMIYFFDPLIKWNPFKSKNEKSKIVLLPQLKKNRYKGIYLKIEL